MNANGLNWIVSAPGLDSKYFPTRSEARVVASLLRNFGYLSIRIDRMKGGK